MNLIVAAPSWLLWGFCCVLIVAAVEDAARLKISNITSLVVFLGAVAAVVIEGPSIAIWQNLAVFGLILALGTIAFARGLLGGGDVKLFAATGLWFSFSSVLAFVAMVFISGGVVAIAYLLSRPFRRNSGTMRSARIPYGIAIAFGAVALVLLQRGAFNHDERPLPAVNIAPHRA